MCNSKPEVSHIITANEEDLIIWRYLNRITSTYKDKGISADAMLQMEKNTLVAYTSEMSIVHAHMAQSE